MELTTWAERILGADTLEDKLFCPQELTDCKPGLPKRIKSPSRPIGMGFCKRGKNEKLPPFHTLNRAENRAICLHRFAGHELLAIELMAYALLAFPQAPKSFRKGIVATLKDEQEHFRLYQHALDRFNLKFGELPLYKHFWVHAQFMDEPIHYVSTVNLTLEMANLDFAPHYGREFERVGDRDSSSLMARILKDEIGHVRFGWRWLQKFKSKQLSTWDAWKHSQSHLLHPKRAKGFSFNLESRKLAGIDNDWIEKLKKT